ncbi:sodium:solute symporter family transporter [Paludibaculum fermentans]|uniref:sodium:solute symporter family transporter n=1 Tax=Paludibaculum fermentans TaxID=1473598 RepID=UPI003EBAC91D
MRPLDWLVMVCALAGVVLYGLYRSRGSTTTSGYLLANKTMPWYAMALSIMATQASAITFISTTGQSYVDGMRFVQFYFGLPIAMILVAAVAVPRFLNSGVYTAYEYLERRFDSKTRTLVSAVFLAQRGLGVGVALSAPSVVLTAILGWPDQWTALIVGIVVIAYTVTGGITAITWADFIQMLIMSVGLVVALTAAIALLPSTVSFGDAVAVAGAASRLNPVVWQFNPSDRYNVWSGLIGGMFLMLAYFGCDQSQVQRYLTGKSISQSRLSLLFNAVVKIPMQFFILFIGAMVFVFFTFEKPPVLFNKVALARAEQKAEFAQIQSSYDRAFEQRKAAAQDIVNARRSSDSEAETRGVQRFKSAQKELDGTRKEAAHLAADGNGVVIDTNYIFLTFVTKYLPAGLVGLLLAAIFGAAMSVSSAEINSLATVSVIDVYKRHWKSNGDDHHYLRASQWATGFWGVYAVITAQFAKNLGSLVEAVNLLGSFFYGGLLGVFALAFFFPRVKGTAAFLGVLGGEIAIFATWKFTNVAFLWYNVVGCVGVVGLGLLFSLFVKEDPQGQA